MVAKSPSARSKPGRAGVVLPAPRTSLMTLSPRRQTPVRILTITNERSREAVATPLARWLGADVRALDHVPTLRGHAPRFTAATTAQSSSRPPSKIESSGRRLRESTLCRP